MSLDLDCPIDQSVGQEEILTMEDILNKKRSIASEAAGEDLDFNNCEHEIVELEMEEQNEPKFCCGKQKDFCYLF